MHLFVQISDKVENTITKQKKRYDRESYAVDNWLQRSYNDNIFMISIPNFQFSFEKTKIVFVAFRVAIISEQFLK